jgi:shikimate kinase
MGLALQETGADDVPRIVLVGFMGTGKTEVGRRLARALRRPFVDLDGLVEARAGKDIPAIFADEGEARFRALEREAVREAVCMPEAVIATGGGALLDAESRRLLLEAGLVVRLDAPPDVIVDRIGTAGERPLLAGLDRAGRIAKVRALLAERATAYATAPHAVDTTGLDVDAVVGRVRRLVEDA